MIALLVVISPLRSVYCWGALDLQKVLLRTNGFVDVVLTFCTLPAAGYTKGCL